jgi:hypothetical protein
MNTHWRLLLSIASWQLWQTESFNRNKLTGMIDFRDGKKHQVGRGLMIDKLFV